MKNGNLVCGNIYRSPSNDLNTNNIFLSTLNKCLLTIPSNKGCFITGDLNYDISNQENSHTSNFTDLMFEKSYFPVINKPTRISDSSASTLDHIWTNLLGNHYKSGIILQPISDHLPIFVCTNLNKPLPVISPQRSFNQQNITNFNIKLEEIDITPILNGYDANNAFDIFMQKYKDAFETNFPLIFPTKRSTFLLPWYDAELQELNKEKNKTFKKYLKKKSLFSKHKFNKIRNKYNRELLKKKKNYYANTFEKHKHNIKETWKSINNLLGNNKKQLCSSLSINATSVQDFTKISNHFNDYFISIAKQLVADLPQNSPNFNSYLPPSPTQSIYLYPTSIAEIKKILAQIKPKTSSGIDEIPFNVLKSTPDNILFALSHIFNLSLLNGKFIDNFKTAKVIPIHKKGSLSIVSNYRPISLLPTMSKILEKIMFERLTSYLHKNQFFYENQFGFRKNHSTNHATTMLSENIADAFEKKEHVLGIFLDLSKAFDTIDHNILLHKLWHYGIRGTAHQWFTSYLSNRKQVVELNRIRSNTRLVEYGVAQGSIIGPLLFLIYVNDFSNCITSGNTIMYADDTNVFLRNSCFDVLYKEGNKQLSNIENWLSANKLTPNTKKTFYMTFRTPKSKPPPTSLTLTFKNSIISRKSETNFLGVVFHEHLTWKPHIDLIRQKINSSLCVVKKISFYLDTKLLHMLYHSLILSHIRYCITTWCNGQKTALLKIQRIANKFIRMTFGLDYRDNVKDIMHKHNLMTVEQIHQLETACFMYKYTNQMLPLCFKGFLQSTFIDQTTKRNTRSNSTYHPSFCRLNLTKQRFKHKGTICWNNLPIHIRDLNTFKKFRRSLTHHLLLT